MSLPSVPIPSHPLLRVFHDIGRISAVLRTVSKCLQPMIKLRSSSFIHRSRRCESPRWILFCPFNLRFVSPRGGAGFREMLLVVLGGGGLYRALRCFIVGS